MTEQETQDEDRAPPEPGAGESLRAAREARGLSLADVAARTRITRRHLEMIEAGELGRLPGRTYAIGFSRSFARAVGLDEDAIVQKVRAELALIDPDGAGLAARGFFEPGDPARIPSPTLAWISALAALLLLAGGSLFVWTTYFAPAGTLPWLTADAPSPAVQADAARGRESRRPAEGPVAFTALEQVWVRFYEKGGRVLLEGELRAGETFVLPADAREPMLITARPDALAISVGGRQVPRLAEEQDLVDVPVNARALLAGSARSATRTLPPPRRPASREARQAQAETPPSPAPSGNQTPGTDAGAAPTD